MIRSLGAWILDQVFEVIGLIAEAQQRRTIRRHTEQAHRPSSRRGQCRRSPQVATRAHPHGREDAYYRTLVEASTMHSSRRCPQCRRRPEGA